MEDECRIVEAFLEKHPDAELIGKTEQDHVKPLLGHRQLEVILRERLTDRQAEVMTAAYEAGYYEWPRETTGKELADRLDFSAPTLLKHLRAVERKFVLTFFEGQASTDAGEADRF